MTTFFKTLYICLILSFGSIYLVKGQVQHRFGFKWDRSVIVKDTNGNSMDFPWAGGINAMHFSQIDLDGNGIMDLIGFDQHGNQLLPFTHSGIGQNLNYTYAPEYLGRFPKMNSWMRTFDYNQDGKMDLFTYNGGSIKAYKNVSNGSSGVQFQLISESLKADYGGGNMFEIYISSVDYPGLADIDFDGDMDIINFTLLGTFVYYFKNVSMETYGNPDHLVFKLASECWGEFAEGEDNNYVTLDTNCYSKHSLSALDKPNLKHTGSTLTVIDHNHDSLSDLLLGDVDYFGINLLTNGGTTDTAKIITQEINFPSYDHSVNLISFPCSDYLDVDNDGIKELVVGSFEAAYYKTSSLNSVHLYENTGSTEQPVFTLQQKDFIQNQMIDAGDNASPSIIDVNGDGLLDIVIGNYGFIQNAEMDSITYILHIDKYAQLVYLENTGTLSQPEFQIKDYNWSSIDSMKITALHPAFGDIDDDGDQDMICGLIDGSLCYFENIAGSGQPMSFAPPVRNYKGINVGDFATPQFVDLNNDQLPDLVIGNKTGKLSFFENTGSQTNPDFTLQTNELGGVDVRTFLFSNSAYSAPCFYRDHQNHLKLFIGSASGLTFFYDKIENNLNGKFGQDSSIFMYEYNSLGNVADTLYSFLKYENQGQVQTISDEGLRTVPAIADLNNDGYPDMILGNFRGGIRYYEGTSFPFVGFDDNPSITDKIRIYPNPSSNHLIVHWNTDEVKVVKAEMYNLLGNMMLRANIQESFSKEIQIQTDHLPNGVYFLKITFDTSKGHFNSQSYRFVVQH